MNIYTGGDFNFRLPSLLNESMCDVEFQVAHGEEQWRLACTRFTLANTVPAMKNEMYGSVDKKKEDVNIVKVEGLTPHAIASMISHASGEQLHFHSVKSAIDVLKCARKFDIPSLRNQCENYLFASLTLKTACNLLKASYDYGLCTLKERCLDVCASGAFITFHSNDFLNLNQELVENVLSMPNVCVENLPSLLESLWSWSTFQCCREGQSLDQERIAVVMSVFEKYFDLSSLNKHLKDIGDESLRAYVMAIMDKNTDKNLAYCHFDINNGIREEKYRINFPLRFPLHFFSRFEATVMNPSFQSRGTFDAMTFVSNSPCYLVSFAILARKSDGPNNLLKKVDLVDEKRQKTTLLWKMGDQTFFRMTRTRSRLAPLNRKGEALETEFEATKLLCLQPNVEYTMKLNLVTKESFYCKFPLVHFPEQTAGKGMRMRLTSKASYAVSYLTFLDF